MLLKITKQSACDLASFPDAEGEDRERLVHTVEFICAITSLQAFVSYFLIHSRVRSEGATRPAMSLAENLSGTIQKASVVLSNRTP